MSALTQTKIQDIILDAMKSVKDSDAVYKNWVLNQQTVVLGADSPMDSIAFTAFVVSLEEKIEEAAGQPYSLDLDAVYGSDDPSETNLSVEQMANRISSLLGSK